MVSSNAHKYDILSKTPSLKWSGIFINQDLIPKYQTKLNKEVQYVNEVGKEGKWTIIKNQKAIVRDIDQKDNNK